MQDWTQFYSAERSIYVTILKKQCEEENFRQGTRGTWLAMEYKLPESDWTIVIKYAYEKSEED